MISNFHTASSGPAYYTLSGPEGNNSKTHRRKLGRERLSSGDTASEESNGGLSLTYSSASSNQSAGESTDSSQFNDILKVLDDGEKKQLSKLEQKLNSKSGRRSVGGGKSIQSGNSSLNYSVHSMDYSTDQDSHLEGSKILSMLADDPSAQSNPPTPQGKGSPPLLGTASSEEEEPFDSMFQPARLPKRKGETPQPTPESLPAMSNNRGAQKSNTTRPGPTPVSAPQPQQTTTASARPTRNVPAAQNKEGLGQHRGKPAVNEETGGDGFENVRACGAGLLDDILPANVKTMLRPYLCGVI
eukprot:Nitzschia sp. Nitz4//scaffold360_size15251//481//1479//NITZ4_008889-RA/size15251-snap-gene-0.0-mRNA-1//1//CDS//3329549224//8596//frame0